MQIVSVKENARSSSVMKIETHPVTFTLPELWLLNSFVRHEIPQQETWKLPPADEMLNEQIMLAIDACETTPLPDYTLLLTRHQILVIDSLIRADFKTPEGARGKEILLKIFRARRDMVIDMPKAQNINEQDTKEYAQRRLDLMPKGEDV